MAKGGASIGRKTAGGYHWQYYEINKEEKKDEENK